ncbi:MAG: hypothetical protein ACKVU1_04040 [bacterium]
MPIRIYDGLMRRLGLEPHERRLLLLMGALVATLLCAYTIAKVLRDALFLAEFDAVALPYAYIGVALASAGFVWIEARVARRFAHVSATRLSQYLAIACSIAAAATYPFARHATAAAFYIWTGSQAMMLLPHFWVLVLDVWDSRRARRLIPLLSGCGLIGGLTGGAIAGWLPPNIQRLGLMWALPGLLIVAHAVTRALGAERDRRPKPEEMPTAASGWEIVRRSAYIKLLVVAMALSVIVSTLVDFQFKYFIERAYPDSGDLTQFLGRFYVGLHALALVFQFGAAAWIMQRLGLAASTTVQPSTVILFSSWIALSSGWWAVVGTRWIQGIVFQTLGKSASEIYYAAILPRERRRIKPAIDTLVERWSDALVGVLLMVVLRVRDVPVSAIAGVTAGLAGVWLAVLLLLNRQYGRAFQQALSTRWLEPEASPDSIRIPSARKALLSALRADDERRTVLALKLCESAREPNIARAVRGCLLKPSPSVRAAAVEAMEAMRLRDRDGVIEGFLGESHEGLRRAAIRYLLERTKEPVAFVRDLLGRDDAALRRDAVEVLFDRPAAAPGAITQEWVEARLKSPEREDVLLAARALGTLTGRASVERLRVLLADPDVEIQRVAILSATRRPNRELLDALVPLLLVPELSYEARRAIAAVGDPAIPALSSLLAGEHGARAESLAARTLAHIASPRAVAALMTLVGRNDLRLRHLALRSLTRVRERTGQPVMPRSAAHRHFLRELRDYRASLDPVLRLGDFAEPEVRLLAESYRESAEMALQRAVQALACWYETRPLAGVYERLKSRDPDITAPALEYLGHVLPRNVFTPVMKIFEPKLADAPSDPSDPERLAECIGRAWQSTDGWLRACAVRAARCAPDLDRRLFDTGAGDDRVVLAELETLTGGNGRPAAAAPVRPC